MIGFYGLQYDCRHKIWKFNLVQLETYFGAAFFSTYLPRAARTQGNRLRSGRSYSGQ